MNLGKLRTKISIQENQYQRDELNQPTRDSAGAQIDNWVDILPEWHCSKEDWSGSSFFSSQQDQAELTTKFRMRDPRIQIRPGMRIKLYDAVLKSDRYFYIQSVLDPDGRHVEMWISAVESITPIIPTGTDSSGESS